MEFGHRTSRRREHAAERIGIEVPALELLSQVGVPGVHEHQVGALVGLAASDEFDDRRRGEPAEHVGLGPGA